MPSLPPAALDASELISGWVTVTTGSMVPVIRPGDAVCLERRAPAIGDIVLVRHEDALLVHRLLARDARGLWLGGDATASREGPFADGPLPVVVALRRAGQERPLQAEQMNRVLSWLTPTLRHLQPARRLLALLLRRHTAQT